MGGNIGPECLNLSNFLICFNEVPAILIVPVSSNLQEFVEGKMRVWSVLPAVETGFKIATELGQKDKCLIKKGFSQIIVARLLDDSSGQNFDCEIKLLRQKIR